MQSKEQGLGVSGGGSAHTSVWFLVFLGSSPKTGPRSPAGGGWQGRDQLGGQGWRVGMDPGDPRAPGRI